MTILQHIWFFRHKKRLRSLEHLQGRETVYLKLYFSRFILILLSKLFKIFISKNIKLVFSHSKRKECFLNFVTLNLSQFGFLPGRGTQNALVYILERIRRARQRGKTLLLCSLDFSKAFDALEFKHRRDAQGLAIAALELCFLVHCGFRLCVRVAGLH